MITWHFLWGKNYFFKRLPTISLELKFLSRGIAFTMQGSSFRILSGLTELSSSQGHNIGLDRKTRSGNLDQSKLLTRTSFFSFSVFPFFFLSLSLFQINWFYNWKKKETLIGVVELFFFSEIRRDLACSGWYGHRGGGET